MSGPHYEVQGLSDLDGCALSPAGQERVLAALADHEAVVWLEDWLRSEKDLGSLGGARGLYAVSVQYETDAAWCVQQPEGDEVWIPKSSAECYQRAESGLTEANSSQQSLREWTE